jgi:hypothetical protein
MRKLLLVMVMVGAFAPVAAMAQSDALPAGRTVVSDDGAIDRARDREIRCHRDWRRPRDWRRWDGVRHRFMVDCLRDHRRPHDRVVDRPLVTDRPADRITDRRLSDRPTDRRLSDRPVDRPCSDRPTDQTRDCHQLDAPTTDN